MYQTPVRQSFWSRRTALQRAGLILAPITLCVVGVTATAAFSGDPSPAPSKAAVAAERSAGAGQPTDTATGESAPRAADAPTAITTTPAVTTTKKSVVERRPVPYGMKKVNDSSLAEGKTKVRTKGVAGVRTLTYEVLLVDGVEKGRTLVSDVVTKKPVTKVVAVGTKKAGGNCDPNYTPCVPIASDVDCAGGSGDGPAYVDGPVRVTGTDIYDLDRDGDGVACDT